ncbi:hypothetical protein [Streptomyces jumonjinensis]|uniref:hypothetical protein n=1 Tax=Streptomyces jumonjinensis TaxID=1945 RepID=UPI0037982A2E
MGEVEPVTSADRVGEGDHEGEADLRGGALPGGVVLFGLERRGSLADVAVGPVEVAGDAVVAALPARAGDGGQGVGCRLQTGFATWVRVADGTVRDTVGTRAVGGWGEGLPHGVVGVGEGGLGEPAEISETVISGKAQAQAQARHEEHPGRREHGRCSPLCAEDNQGAFETNSNCRHATIGDVIICGTAWVY